jgi:EmrB/QacA subfamily drug resistance transporter
VVATVCVGAFMGQLDASIVSLALPAIRADFGGSIAGVQWVALSYLLVLVGLVAPVGRLADSIGRKQLYVYGFALFTLASLACGFAPNLLVLLVFRALQAVGAALLQANSTALISLAAPRGRLTKAIGLQGTAQAVGLGIGPSVGGALLAAGGWRWLFWVNVPAGVLGVLAGVLLLPRSRDLRPRQPVGGRDLLLFLTAVTATMLALSLIGRGTSELDVVVVLVVAAISCGVLFVSRQRRSPSPLLPMSLLGDRSFAAGLSAGLLSYVALFGALFAAPYYLEPGLGLTAAQAGLVLTVLPAGLAIAAPLAGTVAYRIGAHRTTALGMGLATAGLACAPTTLHNLPGLVAAFAAAGLGAGLFTPTNSAAIMAAAPRSDAGAAAGVLNMTRGLGTALGIALAGLIFTAHRATPEHEGTAAAAMITTCLVLAAVAALAALLANRARPPGRQVHHPAGRR